MFLNIVLASFSPSFNIKSVTYLLILSLILTSIYRKNKFLMILQHKFFLPGRPPNTLFCTTVRIVSPGVLIIAPNTPAQNPNKEVKKK